MELIDLLNKEFKLYGIEKFIHPLYYNFPIGLRFELGIAAIEDIDQYIDEVIRRICTIFSTTFAPEDKTLLVFDTPPDKELKSALFGAQMQRVRTRIYSPFIDEADDEIDTFFYRYLYCMNSSNFPAEIIFKRIAGGEFAKNKCYSNSVYIFNLNKNILLHMYDDRGADLIAITKERLTPIYKTLNDWLLEYDRERMDRLFNTI